MKGSMLIAAAYGLGGWNMPEVKISGGQDSKPNKLSQKKRRQRAKWSK